MVIVIPTVNSHYDYLPWFNQLLDSWKTKPRNVPTFEKDFKCRAKCFQFFVVAKIISLEFDNKEDAMLFVLKHRVPDNG